MQKKPPPRPHNDFDATIGRNVRALAARHSPRGPTEALAEVMQTTTGHVSDFLNGKCRWNTTYLKRITDFYGCSAASLFEGATPHDSPADGTDASVLSAYYGLDDEDRRIVDRFLFRGEKNSPLIPTPTSSGSRKETRK